MNSEKNPVPSETPWTDAMAHALATVKQGCDELLIESEFVHKLQRAHALGEPLRVKLGLDPTAPDLHLGHTVVLNKLRQLQDLGHTVVFLIGDFTAMIGDPSGRNRTRPPLTREQIDANAQTYFKQASLVLDPTRTEIRHNAQWCDALGARGMVELAARATLARMIERDDFTRRFKTGVPIALHELLYPLMQGYDSVALRADLEIGGTDQKFNLLVGRELQKEYGQVPQCILTMPLLEGLDGVEKMSKSKGNYIGLTESPDMMFGKVMSISDDLMWRYYSVLAVRSEAQIAALRQECVAGRNPRDVKLELAAELVTRFHGRPASVAASDAFEARFSRGVLPDDLPEVQIAGAPLGIAQVLKQAGLVASSSEAMRAVEQGGVRINREKVSDKGLRLDAGAYVVQVGKRRAARITLV
jgi:tyrosyl-tRNA synthetase